MNKVFLRDFFLYIPETFVTSDEISKLSSLPADVVVQKLGIKRKPVENNLSLSEMSIKAIGGLLHATSVDISEISFLISAGSDFKDRYIWTMAPKLAHQIGLTDAITFDLSSQCTGSLVALDVGRSLLISRKGRSGVISVSTKQSHIVNYGDSSSTFMFDFSDSSVAVLLDTRKGKYEILESSFVTDGSFSDVVYSPFGESYMSAKDLWSYKLQVNEIECWRENMAHESKVNFLKVITKSLENSGLTTRDISYLAFLHTKRSFHSQLLTELGLTNKQSIYLENYGHAQGVDPFLSLSLAEKSGVIGNGDIIVLVSAGTGWIWGSTVLKAV